MELTTVEKLNKFGRDLALTLLITGGAALYDFLASNPFAGTKYAALGSLALAVFGAIQRQWATPKPPATFK